MKSFLLNILVLTAALMPLSRINASPGDTVWVDTYNNEFHNWADVHYKKFLFPDTSIHFIKILMYYKIGCPAAGCDPWDRLGWIKVYIDTNTNHEIARLVTPYNIVGGGYPGTCTFTYDVSDYRCILHDSVKLGSYIESWIGGTRGWLVTVRFAFIEGEPQMIPYKIINLWQKGYMIYGDPSNPPETYLQPKSIFADTEAVKITERIICTGHGQGNTDNAAEFSIKTHSIVVRNDTISHYLWRTDCNTNPCSPQGGTWYYARAGWCPGASVTPWDNDITSLVIHGQNNVFRYLIQEYENLCRPNNPNCTSGVTCADCNYNYTGHTEPNYNIESHLIFYRHNPNVGIQVISSKAPSSFKLKQNYPNPFNPVTFIEFSVRERTGTRITIFDITGKMVSVIYDKVTEAGSYRISFEGTRLASGIYYCRLEAGEFNNTIKMVLLK